MRDWVRRDCSTGHWAWGDYAWRDWTRRDCAGRWEIGPVPGGTGLEGTGTGVTGLGWSVWARREWTGSD